MCVDELPLNEYGLLQEGVHDSTLARVEAVFGQYQRSACRMRLFSTLVKFHEEVRNLSIADSLVIDGSFVMSAIDEPNDIDVLLVLPADWDLTASIRSAEYNVLSTRRVRKMIGFDLYNALANSLEYNYRVEFFSQVRPERRDELGLPNGVRKGLLRLKL